MPSRWKHDRPLSRAQFEARFADDAACARHLAARRWPGGFVCPACGAAKGWELKGKRFTRECAACARQTSVTAGTVLHRSHLALTWVLAAHIVTSHSNGISALQLQARLGLGSYKTAWLLLHKLRRAMVDPDRSLLEGAVEIDETDIPLRRKAEPPAGGQGRSHRGKMLVAGAVELSPEAGRAASVSAPSATSPRTASSPSSPPSRRPAPPSSATDGPPIRACPSTPTRRGSSAGWRPMSC